MQEKSLKKFRPICPPSLVLQTVEKVIGNYSHEHYSRVGTIEEVGNMVVDEVLEKINPRIPAQGYSEDIVLICRSKFKDTLSQRLKIGLSITRTSCRKAWLRIKLA